jgi:hypothetical protein
MTSDPEPSDPAQKDEIDRLIRHFGSKAALIEEIRKRKGRLGPKPQKDVTHLIEMGRILNEARVREQLTLEIGRAAGMVADQQHRNEKDRKAAVKRWKRKFRKLENIYLTIAHINAAVAYYKAAANFTSQAASLLRATKIPPENEMTLALAEAGRGYDEAMRALGLLDNIVASGGHNLTNYIPLQKNKTPRI